MRWKGFWNYRKNEECVEGCAAVLLLSVLASETAKGILMVLSTN